MIHFLSLLLPVLILAGCGGSAPPKAVAIAEVPKKLEDAMSKAPVEIKETASRISASISKDSSAAYLDLRALLERQDLTSEQREAAGQCLVAVNQKLVDDAAAGDERAKQIIQIRKATR